MSLFLWKNSRVSSGLSFIYCNIHINKGLGSFLTNEEEHFVIISGVSSEFLYSFDIEKIKLIKLIIIKKEKNKTIFFIFKFYFLLLKK